MLKALFVLLALAQDAATLSFCENIGDGSHPDTVSGRDVVTVDLSAIPKGAAVHRAVLRLGRDETEAFRRRKDPVSVLDAAGDKALPLVPPRYRSFDATGAVRKAVNSGSGLVSFRVASFPGYRPSLNRLDVTAAAVKAPSRIPRVKALRAVHRSGQTLLTWAQPDPGIDQAEVTFDTWRKLRDVLRKDPRRLRYRIYRSSEPITGATIGKARLIDEVGPLTCWNVDYYGVSPRKDARVPRYVVEEGGNPVPPGTGIYAHGPDRKGRAFYAVSVAVNGEEDLTGFDEGNATARAVEESVGPGEPVLQKVVRPKSFNYIEKPTLRYYVRWEAPPRSNLPSQPYDYLVAEPAKPADPAPVGLHLHCWGGSLNGGYGWWYNGRQGAFLLSTNQIPYDWWTGYHENRGTWRSWSEGVVRDYSQVRVVAFLDWAASKWKLDLNRVFTAGNSMGGSGSPNLGIRRSDRVAWVVSWVGVHSPARSPQFRGSYEGVYGNLEWRLPYKGGKVSAFEFFDDAAYLRADPARETPLICFSNGKNDGGIGWAQARDFWKVLQETRRPHVFVWGQGGHGQRARLPGPTISGREFSMDVRLDRTLPAFTRCSLDGNPGNGKPEDGDPEGQSNLHLYWETGGADIEDTPDRWSMILRLGMKAPKSECTVDVTPRRCRRFRTPPGTVVRWSVVTNGRETQSGTVTADGWGLVTVPGVRVAQSGTRLNMIK